MSAIVSDHTPLAPGARKGKVTTDAEKCGREEVFRYALDLYIANWTDEQKRRAEFASGRSWRDRIWRERRQSLLVGQHKFIE